MPSLMGIVDRYFIKKPRLRRLLTKWYYGDTSKTVNIFNTRLFINSIKENGYLRAANYAYKSSVFRDEVPVLIALAAFIADNTAFVDVGANVGLFSASFQRFQHLYTGFAIYAFEANPDTFQRLLKTIEHTNVQAYNVALSNDEKELEFVQGVVSHVFAEKTYIRPYHLKQQTVVKVQAKRLGQFDIKGDSIILKIDVEGHEYEVLEGGRELFEAGRVKVVYLDGYQKKEQVLPFLQQYGFRFFDGRNLEKADGNNFSLLAIHANLLNK
jgi:FkbM family methyltransferase